MLRCQRIHDAAAGGGAAARTVCLSYDERARSRLAAVCDDGTALAVLLPRGTVLRDGMLLEADDGSLVRVVAAGQPVARITAADPLALLRAVYHLANRHVPAQLAPDHVLIERDPVLERLLASLGATVEPVTCPFDPEPGAYAGHAHAGHGHDERDPASASLGEQLSLEAHRERLARTPRADDDRAA
jgi:urease accessory protein